MLRDSPIDIGKLTAKQRYRVNKGLKKWEFVKLTNKNLSDYLESMYNVAKDCLAEYPSKYRREIDYKGYCEEHIHSIDNLDYWGVIDKDSKQIHGYAICVCKDRGVSLAVVKIRPSVLKSEPNAALVYFLCHYYINEMGQKYVCDGERNIRHETNYQDFLCRVLDFRKSYCKLNIVYRKDVSYIVICLRPFYKLIGFLGSYSKFFYNVYSLLKQDKISRNLKV